LGSVNTAFNGFAKRYADDSEAIKKLVGISTGFCGIVAALLNFGIYRGAFHWSFLRAIANYYVWGVVLIGVALFFSGYWKSRIACWVHITGLLIAAVLGGFTATPGDVTGALYLIFAMMLLAEYRMARWASVSVGSIGILLYTIALAIGYAHSAQGIGFRLGQAVLILVVLLVLYGGVLFRHSYLQHRQAEILETRVKERTKDLEEALSERSRALTERSVMLQEIHHRVKNNLQIVASLLRLEAAKHKDADFQNAMEASIQRIHAMALVHETLYESQPLHEVSLETYTRRLITDVARSLETRVSVSVESRGSMHVGPDFAVPYGLLLNELVTNAYQHAFPDRRNGTIRVILECKRDISLRVEDDGVGIEPNAADPPSSELGLRIVKSLVAQLRGEIELENRTGGTAWLMSFPVNGKSYSEVAAR
jgi:two-component sensor histidine kinase